MSSALFYNQRSRWRHERVNDDAFEGAEEPLKVEIVAEAMLKNR